jgi:hypothetical protein
MLEKIAEINVENKFGSGTRNNYAHRQYNKHDQNKKETDHDSLSLSPAFKMAAKFHLKIKQISKESTDKYFVKFDLNEFQFEIKVDLNKLLESRQLQLYSTKQINKNDEKVNISFWVNYNMDKISDDNTIILSTIALEKFIQKIIDLGSGSNLNIYSEASLDSLTEDIEYQFNDELFHICSIAIKFLEKLYQENISEKFGIRDEQERFFAIQLVKQNKV